MTRTALRHALSALAAIALVSAAASSAVAADVDSQINSLQSQQLKIRSKTKTPKGLATQNSSRQTTTHYQFRWVQDYGGGK